MVPATPGQADLCHREKYITLGSLEPAILMLFGMYAFRSQYTLMVLKTQGPEGEASTGALLKVRPYWVCWTVVLLEKVPMGW